MPPSELVILCIQNDDSHHFDHRKRINLAFFQMAGYEKNLYKFLHAT